MPDGMLMTDGRGRIIQVNHRMEEISGYSAGELVGKPVGLLVPDSYRDVHLDQLRRYLPMPTPRHIDSPTNLMLRRKDGRELKVDISLTPLEAPIGSVVVAAVRDMTTFKRREDRLVGMAERERLASELQHVALGSLLGLAMELQAIATIVPDGPAQERLASAVTHVDNVVRSIRDYVLRLREEVPPRA